MEKQVFHTKWKTEDKATELQLSAVVLPMEFIVRKGVTDGVSDVIVAHDTMAVPIRKGLNSDRALLIRPRKLTAL